MKKTKKKIINQTGTRNRFHFWLIWLGGDLLMLYPSNAGCRVQLEKASSWDSIQLSPEGELNSGGIYI